MGDHNMYFSSKHSMTEESHLLVSENKTQGFQPNMFLCPLQINSNVALKLTWIKQFLCTTIFCTAVFAASYTPLLPYANRELIPVSEHVQ